MPFSSTHLHPPHCHLCLTPHHLVFGWNGLCLAGLPASHLSVIFLRNVWYAALTSCFPLLKKPTGPHSLQISTIFCSLDCLSVLLPHTSASQSGVSWGISAPTPATLTVALAYAFSLNLQCPFTRSLCIFLLFTFGSTISISLLLRFFPHNSTPERSSSPTFLLHVYSVSL